MHVAVTEFSRSILQQEDLSSASVEELQQLVDRYPFFVPGRLLYLKKLQSVDSPFLPTEMDKAEIWVPNTAWLDHLVSDTGIISMQNIPGNGETVTPDHETIRETDVAYDPLTGLAGAVEEDAGTAARAEIGDVVGDDARDAVVENAEVVREDADAPVAENADAVVEDTDASVVENAEVVVEDTDASVNVAGTEEVEKYSAFDEMNRYDVKEQDEAEIPGDVQETGHVEETETAAADADDVQASAVETDTEMGSTAGGNPDEHRQTEGFSSEGAAADDTSEAAYTDDEDGPDTDESGEITFKIAPFREEPLPENLELNFEPLHTVDYFASQGIQAREEEKPVDRFSQQLKSFTQWLKAMKKIPAPAPGEGIPEEKQIEEMAEHSIQGKDVWTEAMAEVWIKQGNLQKAKAVFEKLSLLDPSKSTYFAAKIEQLKHL